LLFSRRGKEEGTIRIGKEEGEWERRRKGGIEEKTL
jgi:hypothetical protein